MLPDKGTERNIVKTSITVIQGRHFTSLDRRRRPEGRIP